MKKVTFVCPYIGSKFPDTFKLLIDSMMHNANYNFVLPTNIDFSEYVSVRNITFVKTDLQQINARIDQIVGYHACLNTAYKLVDYKPMFGTIFSRYIGDSDWWGYFDSDIVFGDISSFLTDDLLQNYDRIFTRGHLTLFRNTALLNNLWRHDFGFREVPSFHTVATHNAIFSFDEWGWGRNKGRGLSYALDKTKLVRQYDNLDMFADLRTDRFDFVTTKNLKLKCFVYSNATLYGVDNDGIKHRFLYVHFQKRAMINLIKNYSRDIYIFPNEMSNNNSACLGLNEEMVRWSKAKRIRRIRQLRSNLSAAYLWRRLRFCFTE